MKPAHSNEASATMKETERRPSESVGGAERWIIVFVGQCVTADEQEEEEEEEPTRRITAREASPCMLHHYWCDWSP